MHILKVLAAGAAVLATGAVAHAEDDVRTINYQFAACHAAARADGASFISGFCAGEIRGVWDVLADAHVACAPQNVQLGQVIRLVVARIDQHPELQNGSLSTFAASAIAQTWPCQQQPRVGS